MVDDPTPWRTYVQHRDTAHAPLSLLYPDAALHPPRYAINVSHAVPCAAHTLLGILGGQAKPSTSAHTWSTGPLCCYQVKRDTLRPCCCCCCCCQRRHRSGDYSVAMQLADANLPGVTGRAVRQHGTQPESRFQALRLADCECNASWLAH